MSETDTISLAVWDVPAPVILQIQDGKFKVLAPDAVKTGTLAIGVQ